MKTIKKLNQEIDELFAKSRPLSQEELKSFGEKNREIIDSPSFRANVPKTPSVQKMDKPAKSK